MHRFSLKFKKHISRYYPYYIIFFVQIALFLTNYRPGTFLVGWDNLFPEFNFSLNLKRAFFAVWQEYRGMGVVDSMSHASTIIEDLERLILSLFMPTSMVRWVYILTLHMIGGMGVFHLLKTHLLKSAEKVSQAQSTVTTVIALISALFYQHNIGTIQQMYLPMEVFVVHFAYLPWLIWAALQSLTTGGRRYFSIFGILSVLATPQAHVPTLFIVYAIAIGIICTWYVVCIDRNTWKRALGIVLLSFATNAFWLLPFLYATITHSDVVASSKAFQMASNDIFYRNHEYGNIKDIALIKGTLLEYYYYNFKSSSYHFMFAPWLVHLDSWAFSIPAWTCFFVALWGSIAAFLHRSKARVISILFIFSIMMLGTDIPLVGKLNELLRDHVPLFKTVFRFVFTKFSILYVFSFSLLIGIGIQSLVDFVRSRIAKIAIVAVTTILIIVYISPSFRGHFFYDNLRVDIPKQYFDAFDFFNKQDHNTRIAMLPTPWYWSWLQPDWGTINSGFFWYAVPQPATDLAFTPWGSHNENFYWELERAVSLNDQVLLEQVLTKYDITWIYLDTNILNAESKKITYESLKNFLLDSPNITQAAVFDDLYVYRYQNQSRDNFISARTNVPTISYDETYTDYDRVYTSIGTYQKSEDLRTPDRTYPFYSLFSGKASYLNTVNVIEYDENIVLKGKAGVLGNDPKATDTLTDHDEIIYMPHDDGSVQSLIPKLRLEKSQDESRTLDVVIDKASSRVYSSSQDYWYRIQENNACDKSSDGKTSMYRYDDGEDTVYRLSSINSSNCIKAEIPYVHLAYGYLLKIQYKSDEKRGWFINIYNKTRSTPVQELYLRNNGKENTEYIILPPQGAYDMGYNIYFNNKSEGVEKVTNDLIAIDLYYIPYTLIKDLYIENSTLSMSAALPIDATEHSIPSLYTVQLTPKTHTTVILHQGFDKGWKAYTILCNTNHITCSIQKTFPMVFGQKLTDHVLVNNWANGWILPQTNNSQPTTISLIFWPQYLQYIGFFILVAATLSMRFMQPYRTKTPKTSLEK